MYLFLDFDGVLRRLTAQPMRFEPELLGNFETAVRPLFELEIVITSTWRLEMTLNELRRLFSPDMAAHIVGKTPESLALTAHSRYNEVLGYLKAAKGLNAKWLAIDDDPAHYPEDAPVLITDPYLGFDVGSIPRLRELYRSVFDTWHT